MNRTIRLLLLVCLAAAAQEAVMAQNNDITILAGIFAAHTVKVSTPGVRVSAGTAVAGEISYARRIFERGSTALDFELPVVASGEAQVRVTQSSANVSNALVAVTPGVRWRPAAHARLSPFACAGIGPAWSMRCALRPASSRSSLSITARRQCSASEAARTCT